jgi:hypothetical protein
LLFHEANGWVIQQPTRHLDATVDGSRMKDWNLPSTQLKPRMAQAIVLVVALKAG